MNDPQPESVALLDYEPGRLDIETEVVAGLAAQRKTLPPKLFYDEQGSALFDRITELDAYYPTRTEIGILRASGREMASLIGPEVMLIEYGSGSSIKTRLLLDCLERPIAYVPIDISCAHLEAAASVLASEYPLLAVLPVCADYGGDYTLPRTPRAVTRRVAFFPGSSLGNFEPDDARAFLGRVNTLVGNGGSLLLGADLKKDRARLELAYNDPEGVTAEFNLNLLERLNRELGADFVLAQFAHRAVYNPRAGRIEMHLESLQHQIVTVAGRQFSFAAGETIHTENSYKYSREELAHLALSAGFSVRRVWTDSENLFSVQLWEVL